MSLRADWPRVDTRPTTLVVKMNRGGHPTVQAVQHDMDGESEEKAGSKSERNKSRIQTSFSAEAIVLHSGFNALFSKLVILKACSFPLHLSINQMLQQQKNSYRPITSLSVLPVRLICVHSARHVCCFNRDISLSAAQEL